MMIKDCLKGRKSVIKILQKYQKIYKDEKILKEISEDLDFPTLRNFFDWEFQWLSWKYLKIKVLVYNIRMFKGELKNETLQHNDK